MLEDQYLKQFYRDVVPSIIRVFSPVKVMVFGSRVRGTATDDSDIDVIIIAESFREIPFVNRMATVMKSVRFQKHVDYLCYTPDEYERLKDRSSILKDAASYAVEVAL
jgi:predicted nucleotidyltransferase